jgi:2,4-dienoyl-CoA reductase-like NADH-dependent reductase (Old Yellow Enzyme family)
MSNEKTYKGRLFDEFDLAGLKLKNRIVRAATFEKRADENGTVTDDLLEFYQGLARGGAAFIITGGALVHPSGRTLRQMLSAHADSFTDGLGKLAEAIRSNGALSALQLFHGGRHCLPRVINWEVPLAPSEVHDTSSDTTPRAMADSEIWAMVDSFASVAFRAQSAGFDAVEIHAAHGYLISSFLSPCTNLRDDYWGGDEPRRAHFLEEILKAVRDAVGDGYPVIVKLNADDQMEGGITRDEAVRIALLAEHAGADAIEISGGTRESDPPILRKPKKGDEPEGYPEGYYRSAGRLMKNTLSVPVILTGGFRTLEAMESAIESKEADMIGLSRPLICEPDLPLKLREGATRTKCTSCNKCSRYSRIDSVRCVEKF